MGVTLVEELPFAHVVNERHVKTVCANCMKSPSERGIVGSLRRCTRCKFARYCDSKCQKRDWKNHRPECTHLLRCSPLIPPMITRLVGRIIVKLKRDGDTKPAFNGRLFASLMTHASEIGNDNEQCIIFNEHYNILKDYLPEMPCIADIFEIYCKVLINGCSVMDNSANTTGFGLYLGLSALDHSCNAETVILFDGKKAFLRTLNRNITKYSDELRTQYCDMMDPGPVRRHKLSSQYYFTCYCELCQNEEIDRQKYSLRCTKCNDGFCPYSPGKENPEIRCKVCGETSDYNLNEVQNLHKRLVEFKKPNMLLPDDDISLEMNMEFWIKERKKLFDFYRKCETVFSPYNVPLCKLAANIVEFAELCKKYDEAVEYAQKTLLCFRTYLPKGHPGLSIRFYVYGLLLLLQRNPQCKPAFDMARESHGEMSTLAVEIADYLSKIRTE